MMMRKLRNGVISGLSVCSELYPGCDDGEN